MTYTRIGGYACPCTPCKSSCMIHIKLRAKHSHGWRVSRRMWWQGREWWMGLSKSLWTWEYYIGHVMQNSRNNGSSARINICEFTEDINISSLRVENHFMAASWTRSGLTGGRITDFLPLIFSNIIWPEVIQAFITIIATMNINNSVSEIQAHGMATSGWRHVTISIGSHNPVPYCIGMRRLKRSRKQTGRGQRPQVLLWVFERAL